MELVIDIINKIIITGFFLSSLNFLRYVYFLIQSWVKTEPFIINKSQLFWLGISISYILNCVFFGIKI